MGEAGDDELDQEPAERKARKKKESYGKETGRLDSSGKFYRGDQDSEEELVLGSDDEYESDVPQDSLGIMDGSEDSESEAEKKTGKKVRFAVSEEEPAPKKMSKKEAMKVVNGDAEHPLLTDLEDGDTNQKRKRKADQWFKKANFETIENEEASRHRQNGKSQKEGRHDFRDDGHQRLRQSPADSNFAQESDDGEEEGSQVRGGQEEPGVEAGRRPTCRGQG